MLRYAITDRHLFPGTEDQRFEALVAQAARLAAVGVDFLQIREKDLPAADLLQLAIGMRDAAAEHGGHTRLLLNGPAEIASAAGLGLHCPSNMLQGNSQALAAERVGSVSCHSITDVERARSRAGVLLFAPVFEKQVQGEQVRAGTGLRRLAEACVAAQGVPVVALGGVTVANAAACMAAGAAGVAGIRMFLVKESLDV